VTSEVGAAKGRAGWVVTGLNDETGDGVDYCVDLGAEGIHGRLSAPTATSWGRATVA
jgi:hypothetical protein